MSKRVKVNPDVLNWAIQESNISFEKIENKFTKISLWLSGENSPTFKQLKDLSIFLHIPFGYLFLNEPPKNDRIQKEFRTINNKTSDILSKDLKDVLLDMEFKKNWLSDTRKSTGWDPIQFKETICLDEYSNEVREKLINILNIDTNWYLSFKDTRTAFNYIREKIEALGIIVMMNGIVGQNTHRVLQVNEFRAFALYDLYAPLIFINAQDSYTGRLFSLIHELIHLILNKDDIIIEKDFDSKETLERTINDYTASFFIPENTVKQEWSISNDSEKNIFKLSKIFHVSPLALSIQLKKYGFVNDSMVSIIKEKTNTIINNQTMKQTGGDYYSNLLSRISNSFSNEVINQLETGNLRYTDAYRLLGIKAKTFNEFVNQKESRVIFR